MGVRGSIRVDMMMRVGVNIRCFGFECRQLIFTLFTDGKMVSEEA